jgi:AcrR family transcriptional regulator
VSVPDTRQQVLATARRLFAERGFAATSLADIAAELGITKTAVAYHFNPKERLLAELVAPAAADALALLSGPVDRGPAGRRAFLAGYVDLMVRHRHVIALLTVDDGVRRHPVYGEPVRMLREAAVDRLLPDRPDGTELVAAWAALGAVHVAVRQTTELPAEEVRPALLAAARAALRAASGTRRGGSAPPRASAPGTRSRR